VGGMRGVVRLELGVQVSVVRVGHLVESGLAFNPIS
jgi:hypothetical protein